jgi:ketosteroid isomerase-like protein
MSLEDVDVLQAAYRTLTDRGLAEFAGCWTDDIEWQTMRTCWYRQAGQAYLHQVGLQVVEQVDELLPKRP